MAKTITLYRQKSTNALYTHDRAENAILLHHNEMFALKDTPMFDMIVEQYFAEEFVAEEHKIRYIKMVAETEYCGTDCEEFYACVGVTDGMLDDEADELARTNAEQYEYLIDRDDFEYNDEYQEAVEQYYEDCSGWWEEVDPDEYEDEIDWVWWIED